MSVFNDLKKLLHSRFQLSLFFIISFTLFPILSSSHLSIISDAWSATYYVDATGGNDGNSGISLSTSWKTIAKVNASRFNPGDQILFKRGEIWREQLNVSSSGTSGYPIVFGAYGSGANPIISGADVVTPGTSWSVSIYSQATLTNVWQASVTTKPKVVLFDNSLGTKVASLGAVNGANQWYWASNVLYIYSTSDPDTAYTSPGIQVGVRANVFYLLNKNYTVVDGLILESHNGTAGYMAEGTSTANTIKNSEIRYGNEGYGILFYGATLGGSNLVDNNLIHDLGGLDTGGEGIHFKLHKGSGVGTESYIQRNTIYNIAWDGINFNGNYGIIQNNVIHDVGLSNYMIGNMVGSQGIQIFSLNSAEGTGDNNIIRYNTVYNVAPASRLATDGTGINIDQWCDNNQVYFNLVYNNGGSGIGTMDNTGNAIYNNVSYGNMTNANITGSWRSEICLYGTSGGGGTQNTLVKNNIAYSTRSDAYAIWVGPSSYNKGNTISNNDFYAPSEANFYYWNNAAGNNLATFNALTGVSANLNADPLFVSTSTPDFHLQRTSPCRAGTNVRLTQDYQGLKVPLRSAPDSGAYQYNEPASPLRPPTGLRILTP